MQLEKTHLASEAAIVATMATLKRSANNSLGFARAEYGTHFLQVFETASGRTLYTVDGIQLAAKHIPAFILANWGVTDVR